MSANYFQSFLALFPPDLSLNMNQNAQHCFLLDGKTILPIDYHHQLFIPSKKLNNIKKKYCSCYQKESHHHCQHSLYEKAHQINEENLCSCSLQSIEKLSKDKHCKFAIAKENICQHHPSDQQINNNETYITTRVIPSMDSTQSKTNQTPSAITIIIKPFISSENHRKDTSLDDKSSFKKRKNSSSSLKTLIKRISTSLSDQTLNKHRLSTFKDITRSIPRTINFNENRSSNILNSRTLIDIYRNKKQHQIKK